MLDSIQSFGASPQHPAGHFDILAAPDGTYQVLDRASGLAVGTAPDLECAYGVAMRAADEWTAARS